MWVTFKPYFVFLCSFLSACFSMHGCGLGVPGGFGFCLSVFLFSIVLRSSVIEEFWLLFVNCQGLSVCFSVYSRVPTQGLHTPGVRIWSA